jgi:hypothetical protein
MLKTPLLVLTDDRGKRLVWPSVGRLEAVRERRLFVFHLEGRSLFLCSVIFKREW